MEKTVKNIFIFFIILLFPTILLAQVKVSNKEIKEKTKPIWWQNKNIIFAPYDSSYVKVRRYPILKAYHKYIGQQLFLFSFFLPETYYDNDRIKVNSLICGGNKSYIGKYFDIIDVHSIDKYKCDIKHFPEGYFECNIKSKTYSIPNEERPCFVLRERETKDIFYTIFPDYYLLVGGFQKIQKAFINKEIFELTDIPYNFNKWNESIIKNRWKCIDVVLHPPSEKNHYSKINVVLQNINNNSHKKEINYSLIGSNTTLKSSYYRTKKELNTFSEKEWGIKIIDENNNFTKERPKQGNEIYLIIFGIIVLIGIVLGYTKNIVVYRDFADLTKTFSLFAIPCGILIISAFAEDPNTSSIVVVLTLIIVVLIFISVIISTYRDNKNIILTLLALCVKIPLSLIFLFRLIELVSPNKNKSYREQNEARLKAIAAMLLILGLVRYKVWKVERKFFPINLKEIILSIFIMGLIVFGYYYLPYDDKGKIENVIKTTNIYITKNNDSIIEKNINQTKNINTHKKNIYSPTSNENKITRKEFINNNKGKYPNASKRYLTDNDLINLSKMELKIMRNEIFARHGYIFKKNGQMDIYFSKYKWYEPKYKHIEDKLTFIEKENIKLIRKYENKITN